MLIENIEKKVIKMGNNIIKCENLNKSYGDKVILKNVNIEIMPGIIALVAPNGYGKTTFIEMCCGLRNNYKGKIKILGKKISEVKQLIGFVEDKPAFPGNVMVMDYIRIVSAIYKTKIDDEIINLSGIREVYNYKIKDLSSGYLKRLAFIISVIHKPKLIFADEPFSNVDVTAIKAMQEMIIKINEKGTSILIASHDLRELADIANRIFYINNNVLEEIKYKFNKNMIEVSSNDNDILNSYLKSEFYVVKNKDSLIIYCDDVKKILLKLSNFNGKIIKIRTIDYKEGLLDELYKAVNGN